MRQEKYDDIQEISKTEQAFKSTNDKIKESLNDEDLDFDLNEYKLVYSSLDDEFLRNNEFTMHLFNFVTVFMEMLETKIQLNEAKNKSEILCKSLWY